MSIRDLGIRQKLFIAFFLLVLLFLCLYLAGSTYVSVRENRQQVLHSAGQVLSQTRAYLQYKTESAGNLLYLLCTNPAVQSLMERRAEYYLEEIGRWPIDSQALEKLVYLMNVNPDISSVRFYMKQGLAAVFQNESYQRLSAAAQAPWYRKLLADERRVHWFGDEGGAAGKRYLHAVRCVFGSQNINQIIGIVQFDIPESAIQSALGNALLTESASALLLDSSGQVVCAAGSDPAEASRLIRREEWGRENSGGESWDMVSGAGGTFLLGAARIADSDWSLLLALPYRDILRMSLRPSRRMLWVFLPMIPLTLLFAFLASRSATRRIRDLIREMGRVVAGDFTVTLKPEVNDEIGELTRSFNFMISQVEQLIEDKYRLGQAVKELELKALQAQINPHFLYNTLDLINWISAKYGAEEIRALVGALSRFYKLSLGGGEDMVRVRDELEHVRAYVQIQNMRYADAIHLQIEVAEPLLELPMLKLVVQPLVENAIFHGIMHKSEESGTVRITGQRRGGALCLEVRDDGVGMPEEKLRELREGRTAGEELHGYGVRNIHERLRLRFGPGFGLEFRSLQDAGTTVTVRIPAA